MREGDVVRLKPGSELRGLLEPWADAVWCVARIYQDDDDDGLRIAIALGDPERGFTLPLPAEDFELDRSGADGLR